MSYTSKWSVEPTGTTVSKSITPFDWDSKFAVTVNDGQNLTLTNTDADLSAPMTVTFKVQTVKNVYNQTGINPSLWAQNWTGVDVLIQTRNDLILSDSTNPTSTQVLPFKGNITLRIPNSEFSTAETLEEFLLQMFASASSSAGDIASRLAELARGAKTPS